MNSLNNQHSFIICTYKESPYLESCIESLKAQTVLSDIIISTSTPTEQVKKLGEKYGIEVYVHEKGGSIGKDWNAGIDFIKTKYFTIAHQDDIYLPRFLEENLKNLLKSENSILASTNYSEIDENSNLIKRNINFKVKAIMLKFMRLGQSNKRIRNLVLAMGSPICCPSVTYNRHKLKDFLFSEKVSATVDWDAFCRMNTIDGSWYYCNQILMYHRIHKGSETSNAIENNDRTREEYEIFKRFWPASIAKLLVRFYSNAQKTNG